MYDDSNNSERHNQWFDPGQSSLSPWVGHLGQEEAGVPTEADDLVPVRDQGLADSGVGRDHHGQGQEQHEVDVCCQIGHELNYGDLVHAEIDR